VRSAYGVTGNAPTGKGRTAAIRLSNYMTTAESDANENAGQIFHRLAGVVPA
jgi:hypothetical protein